MKVDFTINGKQLSEIYPNPKLEKEGGFKMPGKFMDPSSFEITFSVGRSLRTFLIAKYMGKEIGRSLLEIHKRGQFVQVVKIYNFTIKTRYRRVNTGDGYGISCALFLAAYLMALKMSKQFLFTEVELTLWNPNYKIRQMIKKYFSWMFPHIPHEDYDYQYYVIFPKGLRYLKKTPLDIKKVKEYVLEK